MNNAFDEILNTFETDSAKRFAELCIETIPEYFWHAPASSTGKYHPNYALGEGGLARHTVALCKIMNHILSLDWFKHKYHDPEERDCLRLAGLMHDTLKSGSQEDYEKSKWTKFDHPLLAASVVHKVYEDNKDSLDVFPGYITTICQCIESHMGEFNTDKRSNIELPVPVSDEQALVHMCDYLASRKDIEVLFDGAKQDIGASKPDIQPEKPDIHTWTLPFGKYKGMTLFDVQAENPGYIEWAKNNLTSEPVRSLLAEM